MPNTQPRPSLTYRDARGRLYSLEHWGIKLGLDNIREFCSTLGNPQDRFASIHIAGTNGKGSTSAYLDSILRANGYRVGRYTSPHLRDFRERIHINGAPVSPAWVADFVAEHWDTIQEKRYSYFEVTTAFAFQAFARARIDLAVVEVGLGGRLDATNVISPLASVITRIARDHEHVLGHSAEEIAFEKAGIIKPGTPVVIGPLVAAAERRIREIGEERYAPVWDARELLATSESQAFRDRPIRTPLMGAHQASNLAIAFATCRLLESFGVHLALPATRRGVSQTQWPARFQIARGRPTFVYDAAHNTDGARAGVATWKQVFGRRTCTCVFNTRPDKDFSEILTVLSEIVSHWVFCPMPDSPYMSRDELLSHAAALRRTGEWRESPSEAIRAARRQSSSNGLVLVTGSHYLVGAIIPARLVSHAQIPSRTHAVTYAQLLAAAEDRGAAF